MAEGGAGTIVVGVDGSDASLEALRWAARQSELTGAPLEVVTAWAYPEHPTPFGIVPELPPPADQLAEARSRLAGVVRGVVAASQVEQVRTDVVRGNPARVLLGAARHADLLVVGSRGRGAFRELLLGSVSDHCVRHATCPVVVIRPGSIVSEGALAPSRAGQTVPRDAELRPRD